MRQRNIYMTKFDYDRLNSLIQARIGVVKDEAHLKTLRQELERAHVVDPQKVPGNVVTMNSKVQLKDVETDESLTYTLVFPEDANIEENKISVLAPIGTAIVGYRTGDTIEWKVPAGLKQFKIESIVYQPEASGHYHL